MTLMYIEDKLYVAKCNICGEALFFEHISQDDAEKHMKDQGWAVWKSHTVHVPNVACPHCKAVVEAAKIAFDNRP